jgi:hypothetical protein
MCVHVPASFRRRLAALVRWVHKGGWDALGGSTAASQFCSGLFMPGTILAWCGYGRRNIRLGTGGVVVTRSSMSLKVSSYCHANVKPSITAPFIFETPSTTVAWQMAQRGEERGRRNRGVKGWPGQAEGKRSSPPEKYVVVRGFGMEKPPHVYCTVYSQGRAESRPSTQGQSGTASCPERDFLFLFARVPIQYRPVLYKSVPPPTAKAAIQYHILTHFTNYLIFTSRILPAFLALLLSFTVTAFQ